MKKSLIKCPKCRVAIYPPQNRPYKNTTKRPTHTDKSIPGPQ